MSFISSNPQLNLTNPAVAVEQKGSSACAQQGVTAGFQSAGSELNY